MSARLSGSSLGGKRRIPGRAAFAGADPRPVIRPRRFRERGQACRPTATHSAGTGRPDRFQPRCRTHPSSRRSQSGRAKAPWAGPRDQSLIPRSTNRLLRRQRPFFRFPSPTWKVRFMVSPWASGSAGALVPPTASREGPSSYGVNEIFRVRRWIVC